ncbi:MAG TPA: glycosyltransferase family 4 protein [Candidatus Thermoplasmatota archaeon]|nr:glycosyltransferase family 4 protein [Candidatus Thermoplasmatota archaeon]
MANVAVPDPADPWPAKPVRSVCMVTQALYPDILGGSPILVHLLGNAIAKRGIGVEVHTVDYGRPAEADVEVTRYYRLFRHPFMRMPWDAIGTAGNPFVWHMRRAARRSAAPVVHLHSHLFFTSVFAAAGARRSGKAIVVSVHGVRAVRSRLVNALQEVWIQTFARWIFRRADRIICTSTADRAEVLRYGANVESLVTLWNSPDEDLFHPGPEDGLNVVWLGRHVEEKGLSYLVEAWNGVAQRCPTAKLILVGDGPLRAAREEQVRRLGLSRNVRFESFRPQAEVATLLRAAAVFVLPSLREGFPISVVEAMACGKPVVTTSGLAEIVGGGGTTVPARDPAALADALIRYLLDASLRRRTGETAAMRARDLYGMDQLAEAHLEVYDAAVRHRRSNQQARRYSTKER